MPIFKEKKKSDPRKDNMTTTDKMIIVQQIMLTPFINELGKKIWLKKFLKDTKEKDPENMELLSYIENALDGILGEIK